MSKSQQKIEFNYLLGFFLLEDKHGKIKERNELLG